MASVFKLTVVQGKEAEEMNNGVEKGRLGDVNVLRTHHMPSVILFDFYNSPVRWVLRPREGEGFAQDHTDRKWRCLELKSSLHNPRSCVLQTIPGDLSAGLEYGLCSPCVEGCGLPFCDFVNLGNLLSSRSLFFLTYRDARNSHFRRLL